MSSLKRALNRDRKIVKRTKRMSRGSVSSGEEKFREQIIKKEREEKERLQEDVLDTR